MARERLYCGPCKRIFYRKRKGDKAPRHQTLHPETGEKTGNWCTEGEGKTLCVYEVPPARPIPCFVCAEPIGPDYGDPTAEDKQRYGSIAYAHGIMDPGHGGSVIPMRMGGDRRVAGVICQSCMAAGKERVQNAWSAMVDEEIVNQAKAERKEPEEVPA